MDKKDRLIELMLLALREWEDMEGRIWCSASVGIELFQLIYECGYEDKFNLNKEGFSCLEYLEQMKNDLPEEIKLKER